MKPFIFCEYFSVRDSVFFARWPLPLSVTRGMAKLELRSGLKRLQNRYRLVVMNDDTYEEVVTFRLSRLSVYVTMSMIFVVLVGLTTSLIIFTPLKYYIPGAGTDYQSVTSLKRLQYRIDSLEKQEVLKHQYLLGIQQALAGRGASELDTTLLHIPDAEISND